VIGCIRGRVVGATTDLFSHGPTPLADTLEHPGDPGLLGPDSVSWRVIGDVAAFVGGVRALIVQTAHPEVVAGVEQHSVYRSDPLGRLARTSRYVTETTYGSAPEVERAVAMVRRAHVGVRGRSERGRPYSASQPEMAAWVHNVLTDSFLAAYQAFGPSPLEEAEADRFVEEQTRIGALLGAAPLPPTATSLRRWIVEHPAVDTSDAQRQSLEFLRNPPLPLPASVGYRMVFDAAVATLPEPLVEATGLSSRPGATAAGRVGLRALRWALGSSPAWHVALVRAGAPVPDGVFRQPIAA
jgi:uncharacterized protein (DUF2236 family)